MVETYSNADLCSVVICLEDDCLTTAHVCYSTEETHAMIELALRDGVLLSTHRDLDTTTGEALRDEFHDIRLIRVDSRKKACAMIRERIDIELRSREERVDDEF